MNPTQYCKHVEATLGWVPPSGYDHERYRAEARKVTTKRATNPQLYTWANLYLAVALLRREKQSRTPVGVFAHVTRALDLALDVEDQTELDIRNVIAHETNRGDPNGWVTRLTRAQGAYRREALREYEAAS